MERLMKSGRNSTGKHWITSASMKMGSRSDLFKWG